MAAGSEESKVEVKEEVVEEEEGGGGGGLDEEDKESNVKQETWSASPQSDVARADVVSPQSDVAHSSASPQFVEECSDTDARKGTRNRCCRLRPHTLVA